MKWMIGVGQLRNMDKSLGEILYDSFQRYEKAQTIFNVGFVC
jgi:hypothetical protein